MSTRYTDAPAAIDDMLERLQSSQVRIPSAGEVKDYLSRYPELTDLVERTAASAGEHFGGAAQLSLEVYHDREGDDEFLCLNVRQWKYERTIMTTIERLSSELEDELAQAQGFLLISTDFQPPR